MWTANLFQTVTGQIGPQVSFEKGSMSWSIELNGTESIQIRLRKSDIPPVHRKKWLTPWWAGVVLCWNGEPVVAGPIITTPMESFEYFTVACGGIRSLLAKRLVTEELDDWSTLSESVVTFKGLSLGTISKRVVDVCMQKMGGTLPIVFANPDETVINDADHERNYRGFNVSNLNGDEVLTKLSNVINGPDIMFKPKLIDDGRLVFEMWTGTEKQPRIYQKFTPVWDTTSVNGIVSDMSVVGTGSYQTHRVYSVGAGQDEGTLIKVVTNDKPVQDMFPLLETVINTSDSENPKVVENHGLSNLQANSEALVEIQMTVRGDTNIPFGSFWPGDLIEVITDGWVLLPDGLTQMRLLSISGNSSSEARVSLQRDDKFT